MTFLTPFDPMSCSIPGFPVLHRLPELLKLMFIVSVMPSNHLILCRPLLLLPSIFPSIRVFDNELALCIRWSKNWSFSFSISPYSEYSGLISFRIDWFDLLAVQGILKSLLQHQSSKESILWLLAFFMVQLSHDSWSKYVHDYWENHSFDWMDLCWNGIKIAGRNINNFRYADDTMLIPESEEELKSLLMKVKEESEKAVKLSIQKTKIMASGLITYRQIYG